MTKKHLFISSIRDKQRHQNNSNFSVYLPTTFRTKKAVVLSASIENTVYSFQNTNNLLFYYVNNELYFIALPTNIYINAVSDIDDNPQNDLVAILTNLFKKNSHNIGVAFSTDNGKLTFKNNMSHTVRFVSSDEHEYNPSKFFNKSNNKLGLTQDLTLSTLSQNQTITGGSIVRLKNDCFFICSSLGENNSYLANEVIQYKSLPVLCRVPVLNGGFGSIEEFRQVAPDTNAIDIFGENINSITFEVLDEFMNKIELNGGNVTIELLLD